MNLSIERAPALSALARVVGVVERRNTIPILANVALSADGEALNVRATDLDMEAVERIPAEIVSPGEITVDAGKLHDIVRNADAGAQVLLSMGSDDPRVKVRAGRSNFRLPALPADQFPQFRTDGLSEPFSMPAKLLADMVTRVVWAIDSSDKTTAKGCVFLGTLNGQIHTVGTNSKVVALRREPAPEGADLAALLPSKLAGQIARWMSEAEGDCLISAAENLIQVRHGESSLTAKLLEGKYFDYSRFLKESHQLTARTDQDALSAALRRVLIVSEERTRTVRLAFSEGSVAVSVRGDGEGVEEFACDYSGEPISILMNGAQLQGALGAMKGDLIEFGFSPSDQVVVIRAPSDEGLVCNVAQMRA